MGDQSIGLYIGLRGNTPTDNGLGVSTPDGWQSFAADPYLDKWTEVAFTFNADGSVTYYVDDVLLLTIASGWIDYATVPAAYLVAGGRSEGSSVINLHDNIGVYAVAEPGHERRNVALAAHGGVASADTVGSYLGITHHAAEANDGDTESYWANRR